MILQIIGGAVVMVAVVMLVCAAWMAWKQRDYPQRWGH